MGALLEIPQELLSIELGHATGRRRKNRMEAEQALSLHCGPVFVE
ncbi:MAG: hypothetical protein ACRDNE_00665 [Gaiellaceae bacterium]